MKRKNFKFGFTLIELIIALALFATLSIAVYTVLKNSLDSTLKANTQQTANENAKSIMSIVTADLKSSMVINSKLLVNGSKAKAFYQYPSSVIFPPTTSFSSASETNTASFPGVLGEGNSKWGTILPNNQNKIFFYNQKNSHDGTGNLETSVIEYRVAVDTDYSNCRLEKREYSWSSTGSYSSTWFGIRSNSESNDLSIDGAGISFVQSDLGTPDSNKTQVITKLPNMGDAILLYTERGIDDSFSIVNNSVKKLAENQYNLKVAVFQTVRPYGTTFNFGTYFSSSNGYLQFKKAFFDIFSGSIDSYLKNGGDKKRAAIRQNYKYAELNSVVSIRTSNLK